MRARTYLIAIFGPMTLATAMSISVAVNPGITELIPFIPVVAILSGIAASTLVYRMWGSIDDGQTRPLPILALLGLAVPVLNVYWTYRVWAGWPGAYARYVERKGKNVPRIARGPFAAMVTLGWLAPLFAVASPVFLETRRTEGIGVLLVAGAVIAAIATLALFVTVVKTVCAAIDQLGAPGQPEPDVTVPLLTGVEGHEPRTAGGSQ